MSIAKILAFFASTTPPGSPGWRGAFVSLALVAAGAPLGLLAYGLAKAAGLDDATATMVAGGVTTFAASLLHQIANGPTPPTPAS